MTALTTLSTERLLLRPFTADDLAPFAALNTHPLVVESLGSSPTRAESDALVARLTTELEVEGWAPWAVEVTGVAAFAGMCGLHRVNPSVPCAPAVEVAWRFHPDHWGHGYATEAARASLRHGFGPGGLSEIVAFTTTINHRSQAVMERIGMHRDVDGDFDHANLPPGSPLRRHILYRVRAGDVTE